MFPHSEEEEVEAPHLVILEQSNLKFDLMGCFSCIAKTELLLVEVQSHKSL